jgi:hypothetical protein
MAAGVRKAPRLAADELAVPQLGLICLVRDVYRDTPLG